MYTQTHSRFWHTSTKICSAFKRSKLLVSQLPKWSSHFASVEFMGKSAFVYSMTSKIWQQIYIFLLVFLTILKFGRNKNINCLQIKNFEIEIESNGFANSKIANSVLNRSTDCPPCNWKERGLEASI